MALSNFGGQYKKSDAYKEYGMGQWPLCPKEGKEDTDIMLNEFDKVSEVPQMSIKVGIPGGNATKATWMFGYDPEMARVDFAPHALGMVKALERGEVRWILFELCGLVAAIKKPLQVTEVAVGELAKCTRTMDNGKVEQIARDGCKPHFVIQKPYEALYVPTGWLCAERSHTGTLLYGARKSKIAAAEASLRDYKEAIEVFKSSKKSISQVQEIHDQMKSGIAERK